MSGSICALYVLLHAANGVALKALCTILPLQQGRTGVQVYICNSVQLLQHGVVMSVLMMQAYCQDLRHPDVIPKRGAHNHSFLSSVPGHILRASGVTQYNRLHHFWTLWCNSAADAVSRQ